MPAILAPYRGTESSDDGLAWPWAGAVGARPNLAVAAVIASSAFGSLANVVRLSRSASG
jgi:hypothetical protein